MKIILNDFGGYAFISQLAETLAACDNQVLHNYCSSLQTTPRGVTEEVGRTNARFTRHPISLDAPMQKYSLAKRRMQEIEYGRKSAKILKVHSPAATIAANMPLDALRHIWTAARKHGVQRILWLQDLIGLATRNILAKKLPVVGKIIGQYYVGLERRLLRQADIVIPISDSFFGYLDDARVARSKIKVIENWAPLEEIPTFSRSNGWARRKGLNERFVVLYSGTLSLKHEPHYILRMAKLLEDLGGLMIVRSQGAGADWLREKKRDGGYPCLTIEGYVDYPELPVSLASADLLLALLEPQAAEFSVPSKVLTYFAAGRATLLVAPPENLASRKIIEAGAGLVVDPSRNGEFEKIAEKLITSPRIVHQMGKRARAYAEGHFDIRRIASKFDTLLRC